MATTVGPTADTSINDLYVYSEIARVVVDEGELPYRDFVFEYPPLALVPIVLAGGSAVVLGALMLVALLATQWCVGELGGPRAAWLFALAPLLCGAAVRTHFDAMAVAFAMGGLVALARRSSDEGFALLGAGAMTKLWPLLLVPLAAATVPWRRAVIGIGAVLLVCLVCLGSISRSDLAASVRFHLDRPVQIESTPATVLFIVGRSSVTGAPVRPDPYKSNGLDRGPADLVSILFAVALAAVLVAALAFARRDLVLASFLAVLAFIALGRVLSPQYMVWLAPFAALAWVRGARLPAALTTLAIAVTQLEFPSRYFDLVDGDPAVIVLVGVRNALLLAATTALLAALARSHRPGAAPSSAPPPP